MTTLPNPPVPGPGDSENGKPAGRGPSRHRVIWAYLRLAPPVLVGLAALATAIDKILG